MASNTFVLNLLVFLKLFYTTVISFRSQTVKCKCQQIVVEDEYLKMNQRKKSDICDENMQ